jgi:hypothetical protein
MNPKIAEELRKQIELGFSPLELKSFLIEKGENLNDYEPLFKFLEEQEKPTAKFTISGFILFFIGLLLIITSKMYHGNEKFDFTSIYSLKRLEEMFCRPLFGLTCIVSGVAFIGRKNEIGSRVSRIGLSGLFFIFSLGSMVAYDILDFIFYCIPSIIIFLYFKK